MGNIPIAVVLDIITDITNSHYGNAMECDMCGTHYQCWHPDCVDKMNVGSDHCADLIRQRIEAYAMGEEI